MIALQPSLELFAKLITSNIGLISDFATTVVKGIETFMINMSDPQKGFGGAIKESLKGIGPVVAEVLGDVFMTLFTSSPVITATVLAITALFAAAKVKGAVDILRGPGTSGSPDLPDDRKGGGRGGKLLRGLKGFGVGSLVSIGGNMAADAARDSGYTKTAAWTDLASTTAGMAGTGALVGSVIPGVGTAIGGAVGGAVGAGMGIYQNWGNFFGGGDKKASAPASGDMNTAAMVAQSGITSEEVKALSAALKDLDYNKLAIKPEVLASIDSGALKMRQLRGEVNAITKSFKALDDTGLDKVTKGIQSLSDEFEKFNKRFSIDFMEVFKKLDKESQATLLSQLNEKMDVLNTSTQRLIEVQEEVSDNTKSIAGKTGTNMAKK